MERVQVKKKSKVKPGKRATKSRKTHPQAEEMDERFSAVLVDPRFKTMRKGEKKVKIDSRFKGMFQENRFKFKSTVDKRGKPVVQEANEDLKSYYDISEDEDEDGDDAEEEQKGDEARAKSKSGAKKSSVPDARGQDSDELLSSSSDESSDEEENELDHNWGELDKDVIRNENVSRRIAICNADWDRIKAVDMFVLLHSFKPDDGTLESVKVYTSDFGKKRLAEEAINGPAEIAEAPVVSDDEKDEDGLHHKEEDAEAEYMTEQLRKYQLNRLKYYYAIAEFDSERTAAAIYDELDGFEYESSATNLDIRFVPEEMEFDDEPIAICTSLPDLSSYKAPLFITTALQQSKVSLTWDETDPLRRAKMDEAFRSKDETALKDLDAYLASSGEESTEDEEDETGQGDKCSNVDKVEKYRQLLASLEEENQKEDEDGEDADMEITFDDGEEDAKGDEESNSEEEEEAEPHQEDVEDEEPARDKKSAESKKKKKRKSEEDKEQPANSELSLLVMEEGEDKHHFDYSNYVKGEKGKKKRRKGKKTDEKKDDFQVDLDDPRFNKIYTSHLYNVDPSDPHFKKTDAMEKLLEKKVKSASLKRAETSSAGTTATNERQADDSVDASLLGLVASVKASTKRLEAKKRVRN